MLTHSGKWTIDNLNHIIHVASTIKDIGERIDFLSKQFLNTKYRESTLIGDINNPEVFIINLEGMDCLTFIEYIEAMRLSGSYSEFTENLKKVRYQNGEITFERRRHFFTDWAAFTPKTVEDVTAIIGGPKTVKVRKRLNLKGDGTYIILGIGYKEREISYIPVNAVDDMIMEKLKTGDYAGVYSEENGLDISHVGIIIKRKDVVYIRHASSRRNTGKVTDENFRDYLVGKHGLMILRPNRAVSRGADL